MTDLFKMMQKVNELKDRLATMKAALQQTTVEGASGGGLVKITLDGEGLVRRVQLDPVVVDPADIEMLEDLIVAAFADAHQKVTDVTAAELKKATGGVDLPSGMPF